MPGSGLLLGGRETRLNGRCQSPRGRPQGPGCIIFEGKFKGLMAFREPSWNRLAAGSGNCNVPPWGAFKLTYISVRVVSMRVGVSVLSTDGRLRGFAGRAAGRSILRSGCCAAAMSATLLILPSTTTSAETRPEVLVRTYQGNPVLNAERARLRGIDETRTEI